VTHLLNSGANFEAFVKIGQAQADADGLLEVTKNLNAIWQTPTRGDTWQINPYTNMVKKARVAGLAFAGIERQAKALKMPIIGLGAKAAATDLDRAVDLEKPVAALLSGSAEKWTRIAHVTSEIAQVTQAVAILAGCVTTGFQIQHEIAHGEVCRCVVVPCVASP